MAKSQKNQTFVLKINTSYLSKHKWHLDLDLTEVRKQSQMVVSLGSSQVLRWLSQMQNKQENDAEATNIKDFIKKLKKQELTYDVKHKLSTEYNKLYKTQFQQDYVMLVMDSTKDYKYACKHGFSVSIDYGDGEGPVMVEYVRLLGTAGSIKKSTIMFINKDRHSEIMYRINNGRYMGPETASDPVKQYNGIELNYKFIPAKLSAYFALQCSASISVPWPRIIVVNDVETKFTDVVRIVKDTGGENIAWPSVGNPEEQEITCVANDGMGFISPEMSAKWAESLNEGSEPLAGFNTRCSFLKGMVYTVPFIKFAEEVAHNYIIKDAWGDNRDVRDADLIITTSMFKLWDSYAGYEDYYQNCIKNDYEFCIAKSTPRKLRKVHTTNYQYLQDFKFSDEQIDKLTKPTISKIKECLGLDWRKLILYMCGINLDAKNVDYVDPMCKSIMANPELIKDPYVRSKVNRMIQKRVNSAKIGVLDIEGDYSVAGNDPYSLLQNIFGIKPITGLLKTGECYHKYWLDEGSEEICIFRAPMTSIENVCKLKVVTNPEIEKWYQYLNTCIILNSWDTTAIRCNGEDYDADSNFCTNNKVLLEAFEYKPTLMCIQDKMPKKNPNELDFIESDINGFGDSIGSVTNKATNMISLRAQFSPDSEEYKRLSYRISTMMNYQQNAIDRIKGVVARPVPNAWLKACLHKPEESDNEDVLRDKEIERNIAAEIKPWFFIYRYSQLKAEYKQYESLVRSNCKIRFGKTLDDLYQTVDKTEEEEAFIFNYEKYLPVSKAPGTMNRICWKIESEFDTFDMMPDVEFDHSILKSDSVYTQEEYNEIKKLYDEYSKTMLLISKGRTKNETNNEDAELGVIKLKDEFIRECAVVCPDSEKLSNIVIDICYTSNKSKTFAWDVAGEQIFQNIVQKNGGVITFPTKDNCGEIDFCGEKFSLITKNIGRSSYDDFE